MAPAPAVDDHRAVVRRRRLWVDDRGDAGDDERLSDREAVRVGDAVGVDDRLNRHAVAARYCRERIAVLHCDNQ